jgi:hypothetical protein
MFYHSPCQCEKLQYIKNTDDDDDDMKDVERKIQSVGSTRWRTERTAALTLYRRSVSVLYKDSVRTAL